MTDCGWTTISICSRRQAEQVVRLDQLEALVHHGGRIDRDLGAHVPVRMGHRLLGRGLGHLGQRPVAERAARCGQDQPLDRVRAGSARSTWKIALCSESTGSSTPPRRLDRVDQQPAGADQRFLVGQRHDGAAPRGGQGRREAGEPDDRRHHPFGRPRRRLDHRLGPGRGLDPGAGQRLLQRAVALPDRRRPRAARAAAAPARPAARPRCRRSAPRRDSCPDRARSGRPCSAPTEPVEPRIVTPRGRSCDGAVQRVMPMASLHRSPVAPAPPTTSTASSPSSRSSRPPWPGSGCRCPSPRRALGRRFDEVADLADHREAGADHGQRERRRRAPKA